MTYDSANRKLISFYKNAKKEIFVSFWESEEKKKKPERSRLENVREFN